MLTVDANNYTITASRADDHRIRFTVKNSAGAAYNVSANTFKFTVKASLDDAIGDAKFQKSSPAGSGIDLTSAASGIVDVNLLPADTSALSGTYYYDLEMTESGKVYTLRQGKFLVLKDVTTPGTPPDPPVIGILFPDWVAFPNFMYWKDAADSKWVKFRLYNRNMEYVSESVNPPPF